MKQKNRVLLSTLGLVGGGILGILPTTLLSKKCGETKPEIKQDTKEVQSAKKIKEIYENTQKALKEANIFLAAPTEEEADKAVKIIDQQIANIEKEFPEYLGKELGKDINTNVLAWIKGIKYNLELQKSSFTSGIRYLLARFNWGPASSYLSSGYAWNAPVPKTEEIAKKWLDTLKEAVRLKIVPSKVWIKNAINQIVRQAIFGNPGSAKKIEDWLKETSNKEIKLNDLIDAGDFGPNTKAFYKYYINDYYKASTYGVGQNIDEFKLYKENTTLNEKENFVEFEDSQKKKTTLYGVGLTETDLKQEKVGIGFMEVSDEAKAKGITGASIYNHLLKMCTTSDLTDQQVFEKGYNTSKAAAENMTKIADKVATLLTGSTDADWKPKIKFDENATGDIKDVELKVREGKKVNLPDFIKWLNDESFFFGREEKSYYSEAKVKELLDSTELKPARDELTKFGYNHLLEPANKDQKYRGITNGQFYYGALEGFKAYYQFREATQNYGRTFFDKAVPDYGVQTYDFGDRDAAGVGAYETAVRNFMFNADPYYGLQKWSVTSFANHESMMGHHNQLMYAEHHLTKLKDKDGNEIALTPGIFDYTSYIEGWALFMEWFGIEAKFYGTPDYVSTNLDSLPTDFGWNKSYGITSFLKDVNINWDKEEEVNKSAEAQKMKTLHGGVYYNKVNEAGNSVFTTEGAKIKAAAELCNMLQYFGALNEAQLRNMRLLFDTAYHGATVKGAADLTGGWSIEKVRKYMSDNSALGVGDKESEAKRYLNFVGQATSYNSGKEILKDLYEEVRATTKLSREDFVNKDNHANTKKFFDILLRNSALPMDAVVAIVRAEYGIKK
ncbi:DUF885 family protein [Metamycoplasma hyosynoviae]|uniref:DUF885 domain-containing protein n=1 Tax=Metamycoplasma hyosynoviae TaxID=29559 RepID=A0A9Q9BTM5_9BACT|nr:DUF885 family protein [Metamycoplasma hyosynoviae]MDC8911484.1 DUF885 family protein [Metamycoplasma hyosynoviae]MDC8921427.1 DUF885 family protein [Metamycoplasma hyosynoviae]MDD1358546.1 DUF885 family protein [Metamycoplasma hyosynoviae]MDD1359189.1 DUF885 family protein [Metamycoplasma hyosynoviae]MDD1361295.1 DUF885 family protein [Metamycoplasma hyosynoviae]